MVTNKTQLLKSSKKVKNKSSEEYFYFKKRNILEDGEKGTDIL